MGRRPSLAMRKSPLFFSLIIPVDRNANDGYLHNNQPLTGIINGIINDLTYSGKRNMKHQLHNSALLYLVFEIFSTPVPPAKDLYLLVCPWLPCPV